MPLPVLEVLLVVALPAINPASHRGGHEAAPTDQAVVAPCTAALVIASLRSVARDIDSMIGPILFIPSENNLASPGRFAGAVFQPFERRRARERFQMEMSSRRLGVMSWQS